MVVWGHFFLPLSVAPLLLITFWLVCFVSTVTAILLAFADLRVLRQRTRAENRALFEETMHDIEKEITLATDRRHEKRGNLGNLRNCLL